MRPRIFGPIGSPTTPGMARDRWEDEVVKKAVQVKATSVVLRAEPARMARRMEALRWRVRMECPGEGAGRGLLAPAIRLGAAAPEGPGHTRRGYRLDQIGMAVAGQRWLWLWRVQREDRYGRVGRARDWAWGNRSGG